VQEEREVPAVGADGGDDAHAPGFQIMSSRISRTTSDQRKWAITPGRFG
jgi:hypothetical protein